MGGLGAKSAPESVSAVALQPIVLWEIKIDLQESDLQQGLDKSAERDVEHVFVMPIVSGHAFFNEGGEPIFGYARRTFLICRLRIP